jgi:hypothetical protein
VSSEVIVVPQQKTWEVVLASVLDYSHIEALESSQEETDDDPAPAQIKELDDKYRALATSRLIPEHVSAVKKLSLFARTAKGLEADVVLTGIVTLIVIDGAPRDVVLCDLAESVDRQGNSFSEVYLNLFNALDHFRRRHGKEPAQPVFEIQEYDRMAIYAHSQMPLLTARGDKKFFYDGMPVPTDRVDAALTAILGKCVRNLDYREVSFNNKTVAEVRGALARKWPHFPVPEGASRPSEALLLSAPDEFAAFTQEYLDLVPGDWTPSLVLFQAWETFSSSSIGAVHFFRQLNLWAGDRIQKSQRQRQHGYAGIRLKK